MPTNNYKISQIQVGEITYDICDATVRNSLSTIQSYYDDSVISSWTSNTMTPSGQNYLRGCAIHVYNRLAYYYFYYYIANVSVTPSANQPVWTQVCTVKNQFGTSPLSRTWMNIYNASGSSSINHWAKIEGTAVSVGLMVSITTNPWQAIYGWSYIPA